MAPENGTPARRRVVVTGASAGIGRATARAFAERGCDVALIARNEARLAAAAEEIERLGRRALVLPLDVADAEAVEAAAARVEREWGGIDVWVNNAMTTVFAPVHRISAEEFERVTKVTYLGGVHGTLTALRRMHRVGRGTIVQVGSALAYRAIPLQAAYCGAKHALRGFTDSLRCELRRSRSDIHLTTVHMPALNTPQFSWCRAKLPNHPQPVPPIFQPEVAADAIVWASEHRRREVLVGGPTVTAVIWNKLFPGLGDRLLARSGFQSQQTDDPVDAHRPDGLFETVDRDIAAHGIFDERAKRTSWQWSLKKRHLGLLGDLGSLIGGGLQNLVKMLQKPEPAPSMDTGESRQRDASEPARP